MDDMAAVIEEAARSSSLFQPAVWLRLTPQVQLARDAMFRGTVGRVRSVEISLPGDQTLLGSGFHAVDLAQYFLDGFDRVSARSLTTVRAMSLSSRSGVPCEIRLGDWKPVFCAIRGDRGAIELGWRESLVLRTGKPAVCIGETIDEKDGQRLAAAEFAEALRTGGRAWTSLEDLSEIVEVLRAASQSLVRGDEFEVAQPLAA